MKRARITDKTDRGRVMRELKADCEVCGFAPSDSQLHELGVLTVRQLELVAELVSLAHFGTRSGAKRRREERDRGGEQAGDRFNPELGTLREESKKQRPANRVPGEAVGDGG